MSELEESLYALSWNNNVAVVIITLITYEYILQFEKEVTFVWKRQRSVMIYLYLVVRYFGIVLAMYVAMVVFFRWYIVWGGLLYIPEAVSYGIFLFMQWGFSVYFCLAEVVLIWRLYAVYDQSKLILYVLLGLLLPVVALYVAMNTFLWSRPSAVSVREVIITPSIKYCTVSFHVGPMPAIYASIPIICYDILLVVLAIAVLRKHLKERKKVQMKPNTYLVLIVRYHVIYFVLNLATQIIMAVLWVRLSTVACNLVLLFKNTAPLIIVPRFIISIWETHANADCVRVSTTFEDCACWTSPPKLEQPENGAVQN
ncbi:hypothetical protein BDR04DRAFT_1101087 [Suillus decipiens]|nr:hypothetical protein BDR04DRAFT_1101087 [Suillus decipiens]